MENRKSTRNSTCTTSPCIGQCMVWVYGIIYHRAIFLRRQVLRSYYGYRHWTALWMFILQPRHSSSSTAWMCGSDNFYTRWRSSAHCKCSEAPAFSVGSNCRIKINCRLLGPGSEGGLSSMEDFLFDISEIIELTLSISLQPSPSWLLDLNPCDFWLCSYLKDVVFSTLN